MSGDTTERRVLWYTLGESDDGETNDGKEEDGTSARIWFAGAAQVSDARQKPRAERKGSRFPNGTSGQIERRRKKEDRRQGE